MWKCEALNIDGRKGTTMVAVKTLKESASNKEKDDLLDELKLMKMAKKCFNLDVWKIVNA